MLKHFDKLTDTQFGFHRHFVGHCLVFIQRVLAKKDVNCENVLYRVILLQIIGDG